MKPLRNIIEMIRFRNYFPIDYTTLRVIRLVYRYTKPLGSLAHPIKNHPTRTIKFAIITHLHLKYEEELIR